MADHRRGGAALSVLSHRFAPTTSGACCGRRRLLDARACHAAGRIDDAELRAIEDDAILEAVRMQEEVGLQSATDGEFRRASWHMDFIYPLDGINRRTTSSCTSATPRAGSTSRRRR